MCTKKLLAEKAKGNKRIGVKYSRKRVKAVGRLRKPLQKIKKLEENKNYKGRC